MQKFIVLLTGVFFLNGIAPAGAQGWQQRIKYVMDVQLDVATNKISGKQHITYTNNSADTLKELFIHLYWNAFKPGSMMDMAGRAAEKIIVGNDRNGNPVNDYDRRFRKKINEMKPEEEGYCIVSRFLFNGKVQQTKMYETVLQVMLDKPIVPGAIAVFNTEFECQVPLLSRRTGRDNAEGVRYSIGQWYPKIAEYDQAGWHADPYIGMEFYGVWGDYDVNITIDKTYKLGATGELINKAAIGWGYDKEGTPLKPATGKLRTWKFSGKNIHDFVWAADPDYKHMTRKVPGGPLMHFIYKDDPAIEKLWNTTADTCAMILPFLNKTFGRYPYPVYSFLHGGGGGTEYPMATLVRNGSLETAVHELCHSWYQMMLATNENLHGWMDEGFTDYAQARALAWARQQSSIDFTRDYEAYFRLARSNFDEPMSTPSNFFNTNFAYNTNSYYKGAVFLYQLGYITGEQNLEKIMLEYYNKWAFKHPTPGDFIRVAEKVSGMQLKWYKDYMLYTTKTIDYAIDSLWEENGLTKIRLKRNGSMPMPIDLQLTFKDGNTAIHHIPLSLMYAAKKAETAKQDFVVHESWGYTIPTYTVSFPRRLTEIIKVEIDPTKRMADIDRRNNTLQLNW
ncbi:MAG TPA: M1 family metallopeptidase [Ferruginibacter sp.]|nr:M1 family metallopeptidase [Ferruginibacter sp.]HMP21464.1 M1 family metallopeptidase [Ferruginibacter sp.]